MLSLLLVHILRWVLTNSGLNTKESQDFETRLNCKRDLTGSFKSISVMSSGGRIGISKLESRIEVDGK